MKKLLPVSLRLIFAFLAVFIFAPGLGYAITVTSTPIGGNWTIGSTWAGGVVPVATDNVIIADGATVIIDSTPLECNNLTVGQGISGILRFGTVTSVFTVNASVVVTAGGTFDAGAAAGADLTHSLYIGGSANTANNGSGSLTVNGIFDMYIGTSNGKVNITFFGTADASISGTGSTFDFNTGNVLNKGTVTATATDSPHVPILEIQRSFTVSGANTSGFLATHTAGVLKIGGTFSLSNPVFFDHSYTIPSMGGFWLNNQYFTVTGVKGSTPTNNGLLKISQGTYNIGFEDGDVMVGSSNCTFLFEGGITNIACQLYSANPCKLIITGGTINVAKVENTQSGTSFGFTNASNSVTISGGTINLIKRSTSATPLDYNVQGLNPSITGGTLNVGTSATSPNYDFYIQGIVPNLSINTATHIKTARLSGPATFYGSATINAGTTLNLSNGTTGYTGTFLSNIINNGTLTANVGASTLVLQGSSPQALGGTITGNLITNLTLNNTTGAVINNPISVSGLTLTSGVLMTTSINVLTVTGTTAGAVSRSGGYVSGPLVRRLPANLGTGSSYIWPVGKSAYTPYELKNPTTNSGGTVDVQAEVFDASCGGTPGTGMSGLNTDRYWESSIIAGSSNFTNTTVRVTDTSVPAATKVLGGSITKAGVYNKVGSTINGTTLLSGTLSVPGFFVIGDDCINPTTGGTITAGQTGCSPFDPSLLDSSVAPAGQTGTLEYKWQLSTTSSSTGFSDISGNNTAFYDPEEITQTTWYKRFARVTCQSDWTGAAVSNVVEITVDPMSVGGSIAGAETVCTGINSTLLTLSGHTGTILRWESSPDGSNWIPIANTATTYDATNLTATTQYHAVVQSGMVCSPANSASATVTVDPATVGGSVTGGVTVCTGNNSSILTLTGQTGTVIRWESSPDGDIWTPIVNTSATLTAINLTSATQFRAVVQSGECSSADSDPATIAVDPLSDGGSVAGGGTVCTGTNSTELTLGGYTGSVVSWESSNDGILWSTIGNTTNTYTVTNITATAQYRAVVQSGVCSTATSVSAFVTVDPASDGGSVTGGGVVCTGTNSTLLTLTGNTGTVVRWESSPDGSIWTPIVNTAATFTATDLSANTYFRAVVQSGVCSPANSASATVSVDPASIGGSVTGGGPICTGTNVTSLTLSGQTGVVVNWESSTDGIKWTTILNTSTTLIATNLTVTTQYRAVVQSGVCSSVTSASTTLTITPAPIPTITGPQVLGMPAVLDGGITTGQVYTTEPDMTGYVWTVSGAGNITAGAGTNSITVDWNSPTSQQSVSVNYTLGCPALTPTVLIINYYPFAASIDPTIIPQFVDPLPHFAAGLRVDAKAGGNLLIKAVPVQQVALSTGTVLANGIIGDPITPNAGKGNYAAYAISKDNGTTFGPAMWPAQTIEAQVGNQLIVKYENHLAGIKYSDFNILADQTLMMNGFLLNGNPLTDPYNGDIPMVVHLHGGEMPSNSDGGPTGWFMPEGNNLKGPGFDLSASSLSTYPNKQEEGTLWYHPHDQGLTRINVYTGLAGYYFLRGPAEEAAHLPGWSGDDKVQEVQPAGKSATFNGTTAYLPEIEVAIQDRMFNVKGELYWPVAPTNPELHPFWTPEFFGDVMTVNGKSWPYLSVAPRKYRFRMLDGCNARFLNLWLRDLATSVKAPSITVIGSDGALMDAPAVLDPALGKTLLMAPGERYDVIVDFTGVPDGTIFTLMNDANAPYPGGDPVTTGTTDRIMQFVVNGNMKTQAGATGTDKSSVPSNLRAANPMVKLTDFAGNLTTGVIPTVKRQIILNEVTGAGGPVQVLFNNSHFDVVTPIPGSPPEFGGPTEIPQEGTTEQFTIINTTIDAHPIHIHLTQWQLVSRQLFDRNAYLAAYSAAWAPRGIPEWPVGLGYSGGAGSPLPYSTLNDDGAVGGNPAVGPFLIGQVIPANPEERVWKDDIKAFPGEVCTYIVRFAPTDKPINAPLADLKFPFDPSKGPGYVWHCHIIDHEDMDMMRPLMVVKSAVVTAPLITAQPVPAEVCDGSAIAYSVTATSARTISYQWQVSANAGADWAPLTNVSPYSDVLTSFMKISSASNALSGNQYRVVLTSEDGVTTSDAALLTVDQTVAAAGAITGVGAFNRGDTGIPYSVAAITNATSYLWSFSGTGVTINGTGTSVTLDSAAGATAGTLTVKGHNACGDGAAASLPIIFNPKLLQIKVYLEGAYDVDADRMTTVLKTKSFLPISQPYNVSPWNYSGTEQELNEAAIPEGVVDWVLVELRVANSAAEAVPGTKLAGWPRAFFLKTDGSVVDINGASPNIGNPVVSGNLYVVIRHRNHLAIMSATGMNLTENTYSYDFSNSVSKVYGGSNGYKQIEPGVYGMVSGDIDNDGNIYVSDYNKWAISFGGINGYFISDLDQDGNVYVSDYNRWAINFGSLIGDGLKSAQIHSKYFSTVPE